MSIELKKKKVKYDKLVHHFSCDICGKYLGSTFVDIDDGEPEYPRDAYNPNDILDGINIVITGEIYESRYKCLCADCLDKYLSDIKKVLVKVNIGET